MLGVALAFAVHLINASALDEFSQAVRSVNGAPDLELRAAQGSFDEAVYAQVNRLVQVAHASPILEINTYAVTPGTKRMPVRVVGVDALLVAFVAPALMPQPTRTPGAPEVSGADRFALFAPGNGFLNAAAQALVAPPAPGGAPAPAQLQLQSGLALKTVKVAGSISAAGAALVVMDLGAAQDLFERTGQLSRIDIKLKPGVDRDAFPTP